ncbi:zinc ribbon domain-containing protein [Lentibacillus cibarius]|uniref:Zinc ribbon domain-containing protein n=1 Tax=Lentibacillus cibarius TaxID=2583219 RepID=A0A5S3QLC8_9BACI|nr:zinc ribbon domain-containing protein [Lentibacillus cibarius]TMN22537.1 hypothetical protein FFL34_10770 [Lentibacillus cibarius]
MQCPSCGQQSAEGKFCTNCGSQLIPETNKAEEYLEDNLTATSSDSSSESQDNAGDDATDKLKEIGTDFSHFFVTLFKGPSNAKQANHTDINSSIITMFIFGLLIAFSYHFVLQSIPSGFFMNVSFFDSFILPLIVFVLFQFLIAGLTFVGAKLAAQAITFADVLAKYGAYLVPFVLLYAIALIFSLIGLSVLATLLIFISILGVLIIIPTFILMEQPPEGLDRIYILLGLYMVTIFAFGVFTQAFAESVIGNMMGSLFRGF